MGSGEVVAMVLSGDREVDVVGLVSEFALTALAGQFVGLDSGDKSGPSTLILQRYTSDTIRTREVLDSATPGMHGRIFRAHIRCIAQMLSTYIRSQ